MGMIADWPSHGGVPERGSGRAVRPGRRAERGQADLPRLPGPVRVPGRRARQPDRVRGVGRHDRAGTPRAAAPPPEGGELAADVRGRHGKREGRSSRSCVPTSAAGQPARADTDLAQPVDVVDVDGLRRDRSPPAPPGWASVNRPDDRPLPLGPLAISAACTRSTSAATGCSARARSLAGRRGRAVDRARSAGPRAPG